MFADADVRRSAGSAATGSKSNGTTAAPWPPEARRGSRDQQRGCHVLVGEARPDEGGDVGELAETSALVAEVGRLRDEVVDRADASVGKKATVNNVAAAVGTRPG